MTACTLQGTARVWSGHAAAWAFGFWPACRRGRQDQAWHRVRRQPQRSSPQDGRARL